MSANHDDTELFTRLRNGDEAAFSLVYRRHKDTVYRFALMLSGASGLAADATQEAFLLLIQQPDRYEPQKGALLAFLLGVARNHVRRGRDEPAVPHRDDDDEDANEAGHDYTPLAALLSRESLDKLHAAILLLPFAYREVLVLCDLQELPYLDAAAMIACPVGTVRSRLNRARAQLAQTLADYMPSRMEMTP